MTAMVTLAGPLGANMPLTEVTPIAFTLFDGVQTLSNSTPNLSAQIFIFATNAQGLITFWALGVSTTSPQNIATFNDGNPFDPPMDAGTTAELPGNAAAYNLNTPGVWSQGIATPDAGSTLSLMTLTLMALGLVARRFQRAAA